MIKLIIMFLVETVIPFIAPIIPYVLAIIKTLEDKRKYEALVKSSRKRVEENLSCSDKTIAK